MTDRISATAPLLDPRAADALGWDTIDRVLRGRVTVADDATLEAWRGEYPETYATLMALRLELFGAATNEIAPEEVLRRSEAARAGSRGAVKRDTDSQREYGSHARRIPVVTVAIALVLSLVVAVAIGVEAMRHPDRSTIRTYVTAAGQRANVTLADGSRVLLGPATTLVVAMRQAGGSVDVHITGEALFTVTHRQHQIFQVYAGRAVARVLGTTFLVRRYSADPVTRVVVSEGRVSVRGEYRPTRRTTERVLLANSLGVIDDSGHVQTTHIAAEDYTGWTTGQLVFRKTPAHDALAELSRSYGVDLRIEDSTLAAQTLNWTVSIEHYSLADVLEILDDLLNAHAIRAGRIITLVPGRSASERPIHSPSSSSVEASYGR